MPGGGATWSAQRRHPASNPDAAVATRSPDIRCRCKIWGCVDSQSADFSAIELDRPDGRLTAFSGSVKLERLTDWPLGKSVLPVSVKDQPQAPCDQQASTQSCDLFTPGGEFFQGNDPRKDRNRRQAHDAADEQYHHQGPTAANAVVSVLEPHLECPPAASTPVRQYEADWSSAFAQTYGLERGQLKDACCKEDAAADQCPLNSQHM